MALYESYLDEDIDDEAYFDEGLGEDYDEDFDEADNNDQRARQRRRRQAQARNRHRGHHRGHQHHHGRHQGHHHGHNKPPVTPGGVRKAFTNVSDDVDHLKGKIKETEDSQSTAMGIEVLGQAVFAPKLLRDDKGNIIGIKDNLLPLMATKVVGSMVAGRKMNFKKMLPWLIGAFILSPQSFNDLGFGGTKPATIPPVDGETPPEGGTTTPPAQQPTNVLGVPPGILAIGGLVAIALMNDKK